MLPGPSLLECCLFSSVVELLLGEKAGREDHEKGGLEGWHPGEICKAVLALVPVDL